MKVLRAVVYTAIALAIATGAAVVATSPEALAQAYMQGSLQTGANACDH